MSAAKQSSGNRRIFLTTVLALAGPLFLTQCKSVGGGSFRDVKYDPSTLATPSGHGLEKHEYPFDDDGKYRKDWVQNKASGRTRTSYPGERTTPATTTASAEANTTSEYPNYADLSASSAAGGAAPTSEPAVAATQYHKVSTGDTLFALAARYNTSVDDLKRVNGLTSDSIRVGQSLRIP